MIRAPGAEFYGSEAVLLMSYEQQGVYLRLLSIAAANGSIPADVDLIAQLLRLPAKRFAAKVWPAIVGCWQQQGERLVPAGGVQTAQEPPTSPAPKPVDEDRSERMRQVARARWQRDASDASPHASHACADASTHAPRNASRIDADASAHCVTHPTHASVLPAGTPSVPLRVLKSVGPFCSEGEYQRGTEGANRAGDAEGAEGLRRALLLTAYRSESPPKYRAKEITKRALQLHIEGMTVPQLEQLIALDKAKAKKGPGHLLATWIDRHEWRAALDEQAMKARQAAQAKQAAHAARASAGDAEEAPPPLFAASVAAELLRRQQS